MFYGKFISFYNYKILIALKLEKGCQNFFHFNVFKLVPLEKVVIGWLGSTDYKIMSIFSYAKSWGTYVSNPTFKVIPYDPSVLQPASPRSNARQRAIDAFNNHPGFGQVPKSEGMEGLIVTGSK